MGVSPGNPPGDLHEALRVYKEEVDKAAHGSISMQDFYARLERADQKHLSGYRKYLLDLNGLVGSGKIVEEAHQRELMKYAQEIRNLLDLAHGIDDQGLTVLQGRGIS